MPAERPAAIPLTVITGLDSATKARVALALLRRVGAGWALLDNDGGAAAAAIDDPVLPVQQSGGCACCTGQVMLHAALVQLLRQHRPRQLLLVAAAAAEPEALRRALAQGSAMRAWQLVRQLCVLDDHLFATTGPESRALWQAQCDAADVVIHCGNATAMTEIESQIAGLTLTPLSAAASSSKASSRRIIS